MGREPPAAEFTTFVTGVEPRLRRALTAAYGEDVGREATADALAWAWEHWRRVRGMGNAPGYLFRVGQTNARRHRRRPPPDPPPSAGPGDPTAWVEPALDGALRSLTEHQRVAVVLCRGFGISQREVADLLGIAPSSVQNHVERGLDKLRARLGGDRTNERSG